MWTYCQTSGIIVHNGIFFTHGYAGHGEGKNNPTMQEIHDVGPLPRGRYKAGEAKHHPRLGPLTMELIPDPANRMFGRFAFYIHPDSIESPGQASLGCIVVPDHEKRIEIASDEDRDWEVVL